MSMKRSHGFTLIELMVTITLAVVLLGIAVPSMQTMIQNNRLASFSNTFLGSLVIARSEAIKRNHAVRMTAITPVASNEWGNGGWRVWVDDNGDGAFTSGADTLIRQAPAISNAYLIDAFTNNVSDLTFQANGFTSADDTFLIKPVSDCPGTTLTTINGRTINISTTGRASSAICSCDSSAADACN